MVRRFVSGQRSSRPGRRSQRKVEQSLAFDAHGADLYRVKQAAAPVAHLVHRVRRMSTQPVTPVTILAAIDYSDSSALVVEHAIEMAREKRAHELHFLHVRPSARDGEDDDEASRRELEEWLAPRLHGPGALADAVKVVAHEAHGNPARVIVEMASDLLASAIVVGTHGRQGVQRMVMGSVAEAVVRKAGCTVSVVRPMIHHHLAPSIEPPCPSCVETRTRTGGSEYWCSQHAEKHGRRHTYFNTRLSTWVNQRISL